MLQRVIEQVACLYPPGGPAAATERADGVAVRAHEIALRDLREDFLARSLAELTTDLAQFLGTRPVIPLHDLMRKDPPTIGARLAGFQADEPCFPSQLGSLRMARDAPTDLGLIPCVIDDSATGLAVRIDAIFASSVLVELGQGLHLPATAAQLHGM